MEVMTEVDTIDQGVGKKGRGCPELGKDICGGGPGSLSVWVVDVCDDTAHCEGSVSIPPQGGTQADGTATAEGGGGGGWGRCVCLPLVDSMEEAGLQEMDTYVSCRQNTVTQFIATRTILDLCLAAELLIGSRLSKWWWDK